MKNWHWILIVVAVYLIGVKWPGVGKSALSKVGVSA